MKPVAVFWVIVFTLSLLLAYNLTFHIHSLSHNSSLAHDHGSMLDEASHDEIAFKHLSTDMSHADHHAGLIAEMAATPDAVFQNLTIDLTSVDLVLLYALLITVTATKLLATPFRSYNPPFQNQRFHLVPSLRAPPR